MPLVIHSLGGGHTHTHTHTHTHIHTHTHTHTDKAILKNQARASRNNPSFYFINSPTDPAKRSLWVNWILKAVKPHHRINSWHILSSNPIKLHIGKRFVYPITGVLGQLEDSHFRRCKSYNPLGSSASYGSASTSSLATYSSCSLKYLEISCFNFLFHKFDAFMLQHKSHHFSSDIVHTSIAPVNHIAFIPACYCFVTRHYRIVSHY